MPSGKGTRDGEVTVACADDEVRDPGAEKRMQY